jgi:hypothetical protein
MGSETLGNLSRRKLAIDKMDNKLLENCIMSEELWVERIVVFFG